MKPVKAILEEYRKEDEAGHKEFLLLREIFKQYQGKSITARASSKLPAGYQWKDEGRLGWITIISPEKRSHNFVRHSQQNDFKIEYFEEFDAPYNRGATERMEKIDAILNDPAKLKACQKLFTDLSKAYQNLKKLSKEAYDGDFDSYNNPPFYSILREYKISNSIISDLNFDKDEKECGGEMAIGGKAGDAVDTLNMDVPLFVRMLEYAKEDAKTDMDLHKVTENATALSKSKDVLTMSDYNSVVNVMATGGDTKSEIIDDFISKEKSRLEKLNPPTKDELWYDADAFNGIGGRNDFILAYNEMHRVIADIDKGNTARGMNVHVALENIRHQLSTSRRTMTPKGEKIAGKDFDLCIKNMEYAKKNFNEGNFPMTKMNLENNIKALKKYVNKGDKVIKASGGEAYDAGGLVGKSIKFRNGDDKEMQGKIVDKIKISTGNSSNETGYLIEEDITHVLYELELDEFKNNAHAISRDLVVAKDGGCLQAHRSSRTMAKGGESGSDKNSGSGISWIITGNTI